MVNPRDQIELILRQQNISSQATEEEIGTALRKAGFAEKDIATALFTLRDTPNPQILREHGLIKVMRTDDLLEPSEISALLGIDVPVRSRDVMVEERGGGLTVAQMGIVIVVSITLGFVVLYTLIFWHDIKPIQDVMAN